MIVMSDIAYDWIALGVAAILFVILAFLICRTNAGFPTRVLLVTAFGLSLIHLRRCRRSTLWRSRGGTRYPEKKPQECSRRSGNT